VLKLKTEKCIWQYHRNKDYKNLEDLGEHVIINMTHYTYISVNLTIFCNAANRATTVWTANRFENGQKGSRSMEFNWVSEDNRRQWKIS
jgi:hypothetical protein